MFHLTPKFYLCMRIFKQRLVCDKDKNINNGAATLWSKTSSPPMIVQQYIERTALYRKTWLLVFFLAAEDSTWFFTSPILLNSSAEASHGDCNHTLHATFACQRRVSSQHEANSCVIRATHLNRLCWGAREKSGITTISVNFQSRFATTSHIQRTIQQQTPHVTMMSVHNTALQTW